MRCSSCSSLNAAGARFCASCGTRLAANCPHCSAEVTPGQRFCGNCGALLGRTQAAPDTRAGEPPSERKLISVLFVDLEDFTALGEALDPEDLRAVQSQYFELARSIVGRYDGTLEKFIGDAVMAVWGAPQAHEDDAERAVRAALEVVERVAGLRRSGKRRLRARAAVATGEAVVNVGSDLQGLVAGDLVNTASRLQAAAPARGVLVDETTRRLVAGSVLLEPAGAVTLKGKRQPVSAWHARSLLAPLERGRAAEHPGPFVGRAGEFAELSELYDHVVEGRRSRLVSVVGIAGIGKSRLAWEFERHLGGLSNPQVVLVGRSPAYGEGLTFAPLADMVRRWAGIREGARSDVAGARLAAALRATESGSDDSAWLEPRLMALLQAAAADYERDELFAAWRRFFDRLCQAAPAVLIFEDLQWADEALLDFIEYLSSWSRNQPLLMITLARPELVDRRPTWGASLHSFTSLHLGRLSDEAMAELLRGLAPDLARSAIRDVVARAGGVPLYGVEAARMLAAGPLDSEQLPESLHALVAARIDALPATVRRTLLAAAALGRRFDPEALAAVSQVDRSAIREPVALLVRRELLTLDEGPGSPGRGQLSFVQDIVREVAYRTLSRRERSALHLAAAQHLRGRENDDLIEAIAEHLLKGYRAAPHTADARKVAHEASVALRRAAARASALHAPARALDHLQNAETLVEDEATKVELWQQIAGTAREAARFDIAEATLRDSIAWLAAKGRAKDAARARAQLASLLLATERHVSALGDLENALSGIGDLWLDPAGVELASQLARGRVLVGEYQQGLEWAQRSRDAARALGLPGVAVDALITLGTARMRLGEQQAGDAELRAAISEARQSGLQRAELRARSNLAWLSVTQDPHAALLSARAGMEIATHLGVADMELQLALVASAVALDCGQWDYAMQVLEEVRDRPQAPAHRIQFVACEATVLALRGENTAQAVLDALQPMDRDTDPQIRAAADLAQAWIHFTNVAFDESVRVARDAAAGLLGEEQLTALALAGHGALWLGSAELLQSALEAIEQPAHGGRVPKAHALTLRAGHLALTRATSAGATFERATGAWRELRLPVQLAICLAERAHLLNQPSDEARAILTPLGAHGLLRALHA